MLVIILLWNLYYSKNKFSALIIASSIFISISIFLGSIAIDAYYKRIYTLSDGLNASSSRTLRWQVALKAIAPKSIFGVGPQGLNPETYNKYLIRQDDKTVDRKIGLHNGFLDIASKYGIPIFFIFSSIFYFTLKDINKHRKYFKRMGLTSDEHLFGTLYLSIVIYVLGMIFNHLFLQKPIVLVISISQLIINKKFLNNGQG